MRDDEDKSRNALKGKLLFSALWLVDMTHMGQNNATRHRLKWMTHVDCDVKSYKSIELHAGLCMFFDDGCVFSESREITSERWVSFDYDFGEGI